MLQQHVVVFAAQLIVFSEKVGSARPRSRPGEAHVAFVAYESESEHFLLNNFLPSWKIGVYSTIS